ncbi:hypothetical protein [Streptomyces physcomitrii]|uniref:hypothetical protein n=1 Tax=Streptomyces physcomitrii TaxID=2724184 RepID=UPI001B2FEA77|nr:hypothetical protein [Streptomyces physcomitrii]
MTTFRRLLIGAAVCSVALVSGGQAYAGEGLTEGSSTGTKKNDSLGAQVKVRFTGSGTSGGNGSGGLNSSSADWDPPGCWYAPQWKSGEFRKVRQNIYFAAVHDPDGREFTGEISDENQGYAKDEYHDGDKGMYWGAVQNPDASYAEQWACKRDPFWVPEGEQPDEPQAINPEILAGLAYNQIKVPGTKVTLAPAGATKVNLPTWAWLDKGDFQPVSVTASLDFPGFHMEATTTAEPTGLTLKPGTEDAEVLPASGNCPVGKDGSIGEPYAKGKADRTPPCGITYLKSSGDGTFDLQATATWKITWTGTGGAGGDLPDGEYGNNQPVEVEEAQAVNR